VNATSSFSSLTTTGTTGASTLVAGVLNIPQYQGALTLTTTGTSGAATLVGNTLNIPQYGSGSGTVSGQANGVIPLATAATTIGAQSHLDDGITTASTITSTEPIAVSASGASQESFTYNSTPIVPGSATTAVVGANSSGQGVMSEAGGAASRLCTAANGACGGSGTVNSGTANQLAYYAGTGTAVSGTNAIPNGTTATTQSAASNDTKVATNAYVDGHYIANGTSAMGTSAISSGTCATVVTTSATGTATTDTIIYTPNADPTGVTGYAVSATGSLYIWAYPTTNNVNFKVCNNTAGSLTPSALTLNWKVIR
jgi:hypothetical protein